MSILTDRSRIETDWACPRRRYWSTEFNALGPSDPLYIGTETTMGWPSGLQPSVPSPALAFGLAVHTGLEYQILENTIADHNRWVPSMDFECPPAEGGQWMMEGLGPGAADQIDPRAPINVWQSLSNDQQDTARALLAGFFQVVWPEWMTQFEPIAVEQELEMQVDGVTFMVRPDLLLKDKQTGDIWYPDFKTFTSCNNRKWDWSLQQQLTLLAAEEALGTPITGAWVQGLGKGSGRKGVLYHPLVYGYRHPGTPGVTEPTYGTKRRTGFERFNTTEYPDGGMPGWIAQLHKKEPEMVAKCFPRTNPLFLKTRLMREEILPQLAAREREIHALRCTHGAEPDVHRTQFPMVMTQCETGYGRCQFFEACHVKPVQTDPTGSGLYSPRRPHHFAEQGLCERKVENEDLGRPQ